MGGLVKWFCKNCLSSVSVTAVRAEHRVCHLRQVQSYTDVWSEMAAKYIFSSTFISRKLVELQFLSALQILIDGTVVHDK